MREVELSGDCRRCAALCCVALSFDRSDHFGCDKAANTPCRHLTAQHDCALHDDLPGHGFAGCAHYDCVGAGQRVVQELFGGRTWRTAPHLTRAMLDAFRALRDVHELLVLLDAAKRLPLSPAQHARRRELWSALVPDTLTHDTLSALARHAPHVFDFVRSLRPLVPTRHLPVVTVRPPCASCAPGPPHTSHA